MDQSKSNRICLPYEVLFTSYPRRTSIKSWPCLDLSTVSLQDILLEVSSFAKEKGIISSGEKFVEKKNHDDIKQENAKHNGLEYRKLIDCNLELFEMKFQFLVDDIIGNNPIFLHNQHIIMNSQERYSLLSQLFPDRTHDFHFFGL